jgi:DNA polymerase-3 subunit beta
LQTVSVTTQDVKAATLFAATKDVRYYLNGVYLEARDGKIFIVATDGGALFVHRVTLSQDAPITDFGVIVPIDTAKMFAKTKSEHLTVTIDGDTITLSDGSINTTTKSVEGNYPDWRRVLPEDSGSPDNPGHYNIDYLSACAKVGKLYGKKDYDCVPLSTGKEKAGVLWFDDTSLAIVVPFRVRENCPAPADIYK